MHLTKLYDVIKAVRVSLNACSPTAKFYVGTIPESPSRPSFLIDIGYSKDTRSSFLTQSRLLSIQLVYFGPLTPDKKENPVEHFETVELLRPFLNKFILKVDERVLSFNYEIGKADDQLSIILDRKSVV